MSARASAFSDSERAIPPGVAREEMEQEIHHPLGHPPQRLVFRIEGVECSAPLVVSPLVEPAGHPLLEAGDLGFQSRVPADLQLSPHPVFQADCS